MSKTKAEKKVNKFLERCEQREIEKLGEHIRSLALSYGVRGVARALSKATESPRTGEIDLMLSLCVGSFTETFEREATAYSMVLKAVQRVLCISEGRGFNPGNPQEIAKALYTYNAHHRLDFDALMAAGDQFFIHDVFGICRHLNRETGNLENCFTPYFLLKTA